MNVVACVVGAVLLVAVLCWYGKKVRRQEALDEQQRAQQAQHQAQLDAQARARAREHAAFQAERERVWREKQAAAAERERQRAAAEQRAREQERGRIRITMDRGLVDLLDELNLFDQLITNTWKAGKTVGEAFFHDDITTLTILAGRNAGRGGGIQPNRLEKDYGITNGKAVDLKQKAIARASANQA